MFNWTEKSEEMMDNWLDAQKTMWDAWTQAATQNNPYADTMFKQWEEMVKQGMNGKVFDDSATTAQKSAEQFLDAQQAMVKFWQQSAELWQKMLGTNPTNWQDTIKQYAETMQKQWQIPTMPTNWQALWTQYQTQWQQFAQPWLASWQSMPNEFMKTAVDDSNVWQQFYWDTYKQTVGQWLGSPNLGLTREFNSKVEASFEDWMQFVKAHNEYQMVVAQIWREAFQKFLHKMGEMAQSGETIGSIKEWMLLWTKTGDDVFGEAFRSQQYVDAQAALINAMMTYRAKARDITDVILQIADLPTRNEVDEAHRRIYELRKEVKALNKKLAKMEKAASTKKPSSSRKASSSK